MSVDEEGQEDEEDWEDVQVIAVSSLDAEEKSSLVWALAAAKVRQGEGWKESLIWAIRNGAALPDDPEERAWIADVLEGKLDPERGRGRPKKRENWTMVRAALEQGIARSYADWLTRFTMDRKAAWLRAESVRLRREQPDAATWKCMYDLETEEGRQFYEDALNSQGALPCPRQGTETPRELALKVTAEEYSQTWGEVAKNPLTSSVVLRLVTKERKAIEDYIAKRYSEFLTDFQLRTSNATYPALLPTHFDTDEGWKSHVQALTELGEQTPHELALKVTAAECGRRWKALEGEPLTLSRVAAKLVTRAKKSK